MACVVYSGFTVGQPLKITVFVLFNLVADWLQQAVHFALVFKKYRPVFLKENAQVKFL
jgi:uncharacterized membrane protein